LTVGEQRRTVGDVFENIPLTKHSVTTADYEENKHVILDLKN
jgi:hypothetical protein